MTGLLCGDAYAYEKIFRNRIGTLPILLYLSQKLPGAEVVMNYLGVSDRIICTTYLLIRPLWSSVENEPWLRPRCCDYRYYSRKNKSVVRDN
jgi:hypothetical protein